MRRGAPHGYTIVEVMVFLAVTGLLFAMIALTFAGQRGRTQFQTAARDVESQIRDVINDTSTGFYARTGNFTCSATAGGPTFNSATTEQGANEDCIFIGRVLEFGADGDANRYNVYTVAGLRRDTVEDKEVEDFNEAKPRAVADGVDITERENLPQGMEVASMYYTNGGAETPIDAVGFLTSFGSYEDGALQPGSLSVNVVPLAASPTVVAAIDAINNGTLINPDEGVVVCFDSGSSDQHAILTIGGGDRQLTTDLEIANGSSAGDSAC